MSKNQPLADRMRPKTLDEYIGQKHLVGENAILRKAVESGNIPSFILWGPPGVGKTTLAKIIANQQNRPFFTLSAVHSGVKDVRETIEKSKKQQFFDSPNPILFIDEIHRFNKSQQDSLLSAVEQGIIILIGATTENPSFEVISPLLSRCQVYVLKSLEKDDLIELIHRALKNDTYLKEYDVTIEDYEAILRFSGGDARKLYNILELVVQTESSKTGSKTISLSSDKVVEILQQNIALYDKNGEQHYDIISAFIKSVRGSDPNAAVYWLARMVEGGEDPKFIARRLVILAAEDIGLANPNALLMATNCFNAVNLIGWPESRIILSEATIYLATSPKSNSAYQAINDAQQMVRQTGDLPVPLHIRNAPTKLMKDIGYGKDYKYAHSYEGNFVQDNFLPDSIADKVIYKPQSNSKELEILKRLQNLWKGKYKY
ncbi:MAG: AAA family ATPase [Bacteroidetes bacterium GWC2_33_15]|nr:MAG: AAA family ATPase [Bacteroidetes bacterium GWA2_33_15]OFX50624.1 MAG: AAA family ATPase [Bacteroidetes bacterium GWC2_33_15]OFX64161.1 MAG: AAA family ATPase [Bacteroidetes bacterium GWB2_32_14]OFX69773.1 MAG: AAA family ATPase [Bacteroidetes bacterium GWD2_33_33]HAN19812.1 AAA family ATPase [Bacteroidales bacterium]